jgi:hypothetical protein
VPHIRWRRLETISRGWNRTSARAFERPRRRHYLGNTAAYKKSKLGWDGITGRLSTTAVARFQTFDIK